MVHGLGPTADIQSPRAPICDNRPTVSPVEAVLVSILHLEGDQESLLRIGYRD